MREKVLRYIRDRKLLRAGDRVAVAVSGGADSVALLRMLLDVHTELGIVIFVAHFNHGLRGEASDTDEAFVAELATRHNLEFFAGHGDVRDHALGARLSIEAAARELRYRWFSALAAEKTLNAIATGHTLDDQAETVLLKFLRGAGTRGLAGIYPEITIESQLKQNRSELPSTRIIRPLLNVTREDVEQYLVSLSQQWREDESNLDPCFTRNRVRHQLLPLLEREHNPNIRQVLSDSAEIARGEEEYWHTIVQRDLEARQTEIAQGLKPYNLIAGDCTAKAVPLQSGRPAPSLVGSEVASQTAKETERSGRTDLHVSVQAPFICHPEPALAGEGPAFQTPVRWKLDKFASLPVALQRRLLKRWLDDCQIPSDFDHIQKLLNCALGVLPKAELPGGWLAVRQAGHLELRPPHPESLPSGYQYTLPVPGEILIEELGLTIRAVPVPHQFAAESESPDSLLNADLLGAELVLRSWRPGDRFWPVHRKTEEKLKRLFSERHIPQEERQSWPVVLAGEHIVWIRGFPVARAIAWSGSGDAVKIEVSENH